MNELLFYKILLKKIGKVNIESINFVIMVKYEVNFLFSEVLLICL